ncbi:MAG: LysM peptidoglycan-binding domain-containing protein [Treponema sp.]|jgi:LysM repeat protein|nr:LysM peptidoglycan-binding domain-containing protein [Treponema sp.]
MKQIGIKLADGTFYPIMEEGKPVKKTLGLTTVNDNQTRVIVDVYRSKTGTMEDAEYVDSLQIDNLVAHPNGTADINLNIGLDENNKLNAEMIDPETGATSNANVTLVSRTLEERLEPTNYDVKLENNPQENPKEESLDDLLNNSETETSENNSADDFSELPEFDEENFDIPDFEENSDETIVENPISEETFSEDKNGNIIEDSEEKQQDNPETAKNNETKAEEFELPEFPEENPLEEPVETDTENTETQAQEFSDEDFEIPDFDEVAPADEEISVPVTEESKEAETETEIPDFDSEENKAPETEDSTETEEKSEDSKSGAVAAGAVAGAGAALGLLGAASLLKKKEEEKSEKTEITAENSDSTVVADTNDSPFDDFQLPDFDTDSNSEPETDEKSVLDDDAFFDSITSDDEKSGKTENSEDASTLVNDNTPSNGINFDGLYDKETVAGDSSDSTYENESEEIKKKTKAPVIICIICAIICILATLLILFVVPSKYNLLNKNDKAKTEQTLEIQEEPEQEISELPAEEPEQKPVVIESKEEEVVVAPEPEQVIPETPKEPETKPADITYKIKWGDTLWDIADSYYKNPWNYKKIARYNNIKNPDYIISGTTITIPAK